MDFTRQIEVLQEQSNEIVETVLRHNKDLLMVQGMILLLKNCEIEGVIATRNYVMRYIQDKEQLEFLTKEEIDTLKVYRQFLRMVGLA